MPVGKPGIFQQPRRIELKNLAVMIESFPGSASLLLLRDEVPLAAGARVHFPERDLEGFAGAPLQSLFALNQRPEDAGWWRGDFDLSDDGVVIRGDSGLRCRGHKFFRSLAVTFVISLAYSASTNVFRLARLAFQKLRY